MLEDNLSDIIKKAQQGLKISSEELSRLTAISIAELEQLKLYKQPTQQQVNSLADFLKLDPKKLSLIAFNKWHPSQKEHKDVIMVQQDFHNNKTNNYLIIQKDECIIIDSAGEQAIFNEVKKRALRPLAILITHNHSDHIAGVAKLQSKYNCPVYQEQEDSAIELGSFKIKILKTPGHSQNHNCFLYKNYCFTGDLIFAGSIGNSNEVPYQTHLSTIKKKILSLPASTLLFPGHGPATSVKEELNNNPFF